ncbi:MAG TPA: hypothetical protein DCY06_09105 [Bacteroidetes bacterium]|nr:hypothetical protein [Bacteroidota bacterium]
MKKKKKIKLIYFEISNSEIDTDQAVAQRRCFSEIHIHRLTKRGRKALLCAEVTLKKNPAKIFISAG